MLQQGLILVFLVMLSSAFDPGERDALLAFIKGADPQNIVIPTWTNTDPCKWPGLGCNNTATPGRVTNLSIEKKNLSGSVQEGTLSKLPELRVMSLSDNALVGPIPADLSKCSNLKKLYLANNKFTGRIPESFQELKRLDRITLSNNLLDGIIPAQMGRNQQKILTLLLDHNYLTGTIPDLKLPNLQNFSVSFNKLSGRIPQSLEKMGASAFAGNVDLCGEPLNKVCPKKKMTGIIVAIIAICAGIAVLFVAAVIYQCRKTEDVFAGEKTPAKKVEDSELHSVDIDSISRQFHEATPETEAGTLFFTDEKYRQFDLKDLLRASAELLGKGSGGTTYKAAIGEGTVVAVKRLIDRSLTEKKDFEQQMEAIGKIKHGHLLPLMAYYYYAKEEKLLVYDYLPNRNLYTRLHGNRSAANRVPLSWFERLRIAHGVAKGLTFLHEEFQRLAHGNIKSTNIIFDASNQPCIADFGLFPFTVATQLAQQNGYAAPELITSRKASQKSDVYSFGVVLLELLTGRLAAAQGSKIDLPRWVNSVVREEWTAEVFDCELVRNVEEEMVYLLRIAMDCVSPAPDQRPKMSQVVKMIEDIIDARGTPSNSFSSELPSASIQAVNLDKSTSTTEEESSEFKG